MSNAVELSSGALGYITGSVKNGVTVKPGNVVTWDANGDLVLAGASDGYKALFVVLPRFGAGETADTSIASPASGAKQTVQCAVTARGKVLNVRVEATAAYTAGDILTNGANGQVKDHASNNSVFGWVTPDGNETAAGTAGRLVPVMCA